MLVWTYGGEELTGGIYFGDKGRMQTEKMVKQPLTEKIPVYEVERLELAFQTAKRRKKLTSVDKANVLSSRLWREVVGNQDYPR